MFDGVSTIAQVRKTTFGTSGPFFWIVPKFSHEKHVDEHDQKGPLNAACPLIMA